MQKQYSMAELVSELSKRSNIVDTIIKAKFDSANARRSAQNSFEEYGVNDFKKKFLRHTRSH